MQDKRPKREADSPRPVTPTPKKAATLRSPNPKHPARTGWAEAARRIAAAGDDRLVMGEFCNAGSSDIVW